MGGNRCLPALPASQQREEQLILGEGHSATSPESPSSSCWALGPAGSPLLLAPNPETATLRCVLLRSVLWPLLATPPALGDEGLSCSLHPSLTQHSSVWPQGVIECGTPVRVINVKLYIGNSVMRHQHFGAHERKQVFEALVLNSSVPKLAGF